MAMIEHLQAYFTILVSLTAEMAPYLLLGFFLAGITHAFFPKNWIKTHLNGNSFVQSLKASVFGVPLPVCSCGIIPLAKQLKKSGASNAGVAAFLSSTPQTGVDSIAATAGLMGWPFATIRVIVAFVSGILTGSLIGISESAKNQSLQVNSDDVPSAPTKRSPGSILHYSLVELPGDIRGSLTLGLVIAAAISLLVPEFDQLTGEHHVWWSYLAVMLLAIPLYVCSTGSIPIAIALMLSGFSPGAALVFLVAGPATNIVTLVTMTDIIGWRNTAVYLATVIGIALLAAWLIDTAFIDLRMDLAVEHAHHNRISLLQWISLSILVISLFYDYGRSLKSRLRAKFQSRTSEPLNAYELEIKGIGCKKCAAKITGLIEELKGHQQVSIDIESGRVSYQAPLPEFQQIREKLAPEGYEVIEAREC